MRTATLLVLAAIAAGMLAGCSSRSISNSGYRASGYGYNPEYHGELSELAVLGATNMDAVSETEIKAAMEGSKAVLLQKADAIVLVQSGASFPDVDMMNEMQKYFKVVPLSGVPESPSWSPAHQESRNTQSLHKSLRLAAARAGAKILIVYWGVLESGRESQVTKTISWVPIAGAMIPDETQLMRIRLKAAVIDVATGNWIMLTPRTFDDKRISARVNREISDQDQVALLKKQAYNELANTLLGYFSL